MIVYALKSTGKSRGPRYATWEHTWGTSLHRAQLYETRELAEKGLKSRRLAPEEWEITKVRINEVKEGEQPVPQLTPFATLPETGQMTEPA